MLHARNVTWPALRESLNRWVEMHELAVAPQLVKLVEVYRIERRDHDGFSTHFQIQVISDSHIPVRQVIWINDEARLADFFDAAVVKQVLADEHVVLHGLVHEPALPVVQPWRRTGDCLIAGRMVLAAACKYDEVVLVGARHFCPTMATQLSAIKEDRIIEAEQLGKAEQGFIDQFGAFMSRKEAYQVALRAGQLNKRRVKSPGDGILFSEDLY